MESWEGGGSDGGLAALSPLQDSLQPLSAQLSGLPRGSGGDPSGVRSVAPAAQRRGFPTLL